MLIASEPPPPSHSGYPHTFQLFTRTVSICPRMRSGDLLKLWNTGREQLTHYEPESAQGLSSDWKKLRRIGSCKSSSIVL